MTVSAETPLHSFPVSGIDTGENYAFTFTKLSTSDVVVKYIITSNSTSYTLTEGTHYSVGASSITVLATGESYVDGILAANPPGTLAVSRSIPMDQTYNPSIGGPLDVDALEAALDKMIYNMQDSYSTAVPNAAAIASAFANKANIDIVAGSAGNITAVAGIQANVNTVAGISTDVTTVAGISANVTSAATNESNINSAVSNATNINTVAGIASDVTAVSGISSDVTTVSTNAANVNTVAGISTDVTAVAGNNANVTAVATNETNISAAATNATNINAAVTNASNINAVAGISANVTSVAGNTTNINAAVANETNINSSVANETNINAAVTNATNINSAVANAANINSVAAISADVTSTAANSVDISHVADNLTEILASAAALAALDTATTPDGWTSSTDTWVYVDANTFKIVGVDRSSQFPVGAKVELTNPGVIYRYVSSAAFSTDTTVTLLNNAGTALANSAITVPRYSYQDTPGGFPNWGSANQSSALALEVAALVAYSDSEISFPPSTFRLDATTANQATQTNVNGQTVSSMAISDILHFGDGYIPMPELEAMSIDLTIQMSSAVASKNVKLVTDVYNSAGAVVRQVTFDDVSVPSDTTETTITLSNVLLNTDTAAPTEGRVEIQRLATTTNEHSGDVQVKKAVVSYV